MIQTSQMANQETSFSARSERLISAKTAEMDSEPLMAWRERRTETRSTLDLI